jgi:hypothetical protein
VQASESSTAQQPFSLGQVVASVACLDDPAQTYALYLPSAYTPDQHWPIIYAFDPSARGQLPTKLFHEAAERLGYIVVCSNNSHNGPWAPSLMAAQAVWRDTHTRFSLDPTRIYTTGCSGGTAPAVTLATMQNAAGVIACAGALEAEQVAGINNHTLWISVAGNADFNYDLNRALVELLIGRAIVARLASFEGPHRWPPEEIASQALEYMHLGAMRVGLLHPDTAFIDHYAKQGQTRAQTFVALHRADLASEEYAALARELAGLAPTEPFVADAQRLKDMPEAQKNRRHEMEQAARYNRQVNEVSTLLARFEHGTPSGPQRALHTIDPSKPQRRGGEDPLMGADDPNAVDEPENNLSVASEMESRIDQLIHDEKSKKDGTRITATRVSDWLYVATFPTAKERLDEHNFELALKLFGLCARLRPTSSSPVYEIARAQVALGNKKKALAELKRAKSLGFKEAASLVDDPEWNALRADTEFRQIFDAIQAASQNDLEIGGKTAPMAIPTKTSATDVVPKQSLVSPAAAVANAAPPAIVHPAQTDTAQAERVRNTSSAEIDSLVHVLPRQKVRAVFGDIDILILCDEVGHGYIDGVIITNVKPGTRAEKMGLKKGMEITEIMGHKLRENVSRPDFDRIMDEPLEGRFFRLKVRDQLVVSSRTNNETPFVLLTDVPPDQIEKLYPSREVVLLVKE